MGPTRKELLRHIVDLIVATEDLTRATEEQTQVYRALREDIARLSRRRPRLRHVGKLHGLGRPGAQMSPTVTPMRARRPK
jgi:hypothetical protein